MSKILQCKKYYNVKVLKNKMNVLNNLMMGSPLGFVLDDIFMFELENVIVPSLHEYLSFCV